LEAQEDARPKTSVGPNGFIVMAPRKGISSFRNGDKMSTIAGGASMEQLALELTRGLRQPVIDGTGLRGSFQFTLHWMRDPLTEGPTLSEALRQVGLRLERRVIPVKVFLVDHIEKVPTAN
jgi:uncharacterized protein (TIGR03435 family)